MSPQRVIWAIWSKDTKTHRSYTLRGNDFKEEGTLWVPKDAERVEQLPLIFVEPDSKDYALFERMFKPKDRAGAGPASQRKEEK